MNNNNNNNNNNKIRSPDGLGVGLVPATLEFWVRFPNERNQAKQGATLC